MSYISKLEEKFDTKVRPGQHKYKCPECQKRQPGKRGQMNLSINSHTGYYKCHDVDCEYNKGGSVAYRNAPKIGSNRVPDRKLLSGSENSLERAYFESYFSKRGISKRVLDKNMVCFGQFDFREGSGFVKKRGMTIPYFREGDFVTYKRRSSEKDFQLFPGGEMIFYGMNTTRMRNDEDGLLTLSRKVVVVVEGEPDVWTLQEVGFGVDEPVPIDLHGEAFTAGMAYGTWSVPAGASQKEDSDRAPVLNYVENCIAHVSLVEEFILFTDDDKPGRILRKELIRRFGAAKCKVVTYPKETFSFTDKDGKTVVRACKDANEVLMMFGAGKVREMVLNAKSVPLEGVHQAMSLIDEIWDFTGKGTTLAPDPKFGRMGFFWRVKEGEVGVLFGDPGTGKTEFVTQLWLNMSLEYGWKWAIFSPENFPPKRFFIHMLHVMLGEDPVEMRKRDGDDMAMKKVSFCLKFLDNHVFYIYPPEGDRHTIGNINNIFEYLILTKGINGCILDPYNQLDSDTKSFETIDAKISRDLADTKRFAVKYGLNYWILAHPKTPNGGLKEGDRPLPPSPFTLHGGTMWWNKVDFMISLQRCYEWTTVYGKDDPHIEVAVHKIKDKYTGGKKTQSTYHLDPPFPDSNEYLVLYWDRDSRRYSAGAGKPSLINWNIGTYFQNGKQTKQSVIEGFIPIDDTDDLPF